MLLLLQCRYYSAKSREGFTQEEHSPGDIFCRCNCQMDLWSVACVGTLTVTAVMFCLPCKLVIRTSFGKRF